MKIILGKMYPGSNFTDLGEKTASSTAKTSDYISKASRGGLYMPTENFMLILRKFETLFTKFHGDTISFEKNPIEKLSVILQNQFPHLPKAILRMYSKTRFFIRLRLLNKRLREVTNSMKKKHLKHISKIKY